MNLLRILKNILPVLLLLSCTSTDEPQESQAVVTNNVETVAAISSIDTVKKEVPAMIYFKQEACKGKEEKLIRKKMNGDKLTIEMDLVRDCGAKYYASFKLGGDTLDIDLKLKPSGVIKQKNGKIDSIYSGDECYCTYKFLFMFNHMVNEPKVLLVDGDKIRTGWYK
jgi:hypothetical protein